jgi:hypothetical protein
VKPIAKNIGWLLLLVFCRELPGAFPGIAGIQKCSGYLQRLISNRTGKHDGNPVQYYPKILPAHDICFLVQGICLDVGRILPGSNAILNTLIEDIEAVGGVVSSRRLVAAIRFTDFFRDHELSKFSVDLETGCPTIGLSRGADIGEIEHERQHFYDWKRIRDDKISEGLAASEAGIESWRYWSIPAHQVEFEENAVRRELRFSNISVRDPLYLSRIIYPQVVGIIRYAEIGEGSGVDAHHQEIVRLIDEAIDKSLHLYSERQTSAAESGRTKMLSEMKVPQRFVQAFRERLEQRGLH